MPRDFILDDQDGIRDPAGMNGRGWRPTSTWSPERSPRWQHHQLREPGRHRGGGDGARAARRLRDGAAPRREGLGVALVDIGGGTTDLALFVNGAICPHGGAPTGGDHFTNDIAVGLRTPVPEAERIKVKYGCALWRTWWTTSRRSRCPAWAGASRGCCRATSCARSCSRAPRRSSTCWGGDQAGRLRRLPHVGAGGGRRARSSRGSQIAEQIFDLPVRRGGPAGIGGLVDGVNSPSFPRPWGW